MFSQSVYLIDLVPIRKKFSTFTVLKVKHENKYNFYSRDFSNYIIFITTL